MDDEAKRQRGLKYATSLNFTEAQYEEALKMNGALDNHNQLLMRLIDVSSRGDTCGSISNGNKAGSSNNKSNNFNQTQDRESSSSCYSSTTSFPTSSSEQSLESLLQPPNSLRKIFIDGPNVARTHGKDASFSWLGIKLCVDWFLSRQHRVKVFVPVDRCNQATDMAIMNYLQDLDALIETPSGCNDDLFLIEAAMHNNGVIVSNDLYRDEKRLKVELQSFIHLNRLPYVFVDDLFIPANDPRGRSGPTLDDFLRESYETNNKPSGLRKMSRAKSYQKYKKTGGLTKQNQTPNYATNVSNMNQSTSLQVTRSLPLYQATVTENYTQQQASSDIQSISHYHCPHGNQQQNHHPQRQQVRKAISISYTNSANNTKESDTQYGRKPALQRTKSQNV